MLNGGQTFCCAPPSVHGKLAHAHGTVVIALSFPELQRDRESPLNMVFGVAAMDQSKSGLRMSHETFESMVFKKTKNDIKNFPVILLLPHQAYLVP